jgi:hypothetical protein
MTDEYGLLNQWGFNLQSKLSEKITFVRIDQTHALHEAQIELNISAKTAHRRPS